MASITDLAPLKVGDFSSHLDTLFELQTRGNKIPLKLVKAEAGGESRRDGGAFSLSFIAPAGRVLPQAIYWVTHPALGPMEIFLVPVGPVQGGNGYHAVFT
jgi:hypothetical protein